ncbi:uncharacterized protein C8Q71DRAFT_717316 [Rhodofomes roseus]|uniref:Uncharacterized protein n=1 Tax=Rhodofomes roseus TaxID=34475 RepID=A0ABQ8K165_9APHY|nr:uncharacterized protein C8Q71DRAFT_717316 [Rhodofomes roseus]KAH9830208.1 hypothetical protein C8Q71DRAFT_717316 [Rhodofomes roseus]
MSPETWKRKPTTLAAIFGITIPYRPPTSPFGAFIWRKRMLFETTIGLCLLETWEKILMIVILYSIAIFAMTGLYKYAPQSAVYATQRATYYLLGQEPDPSADGHVAGWAARNLTGEL